LCKSLLGKKGKDGNRIGVFPKVIFSLWGRSGFAGGGRKGRVFAAFGGEFSGLKKESRIILFSTSEGREEALTP